MSAGRRWVIVLGVLIIVMSSSEVGVAPAAEAADRPGGYEDPLHARRDVTSASRGTAATNGALPATPIPLPGFPSPSTTGVPAGTRLRPSGALVLSTPGQVVDGLEIAGNVLITANDVTIRRSRIRSRAYSVVEIGEDVTGTLLEDVEPDGTGRAVDDNGIYGEATVRRADIHGVDVGAVLESDSVLEDSYIHGLIAPGSSAFIGVVIDGDRTDVVVRHNTIIVTAEQTAALLVSNYFGPVHSIRVEDNHLSGGAFTVEVDGGFTGGAIDDVRVATNRFGSHRFGYGAVRAATVADVGNIDVGNGQAIGLSGV